MEELLGKIKEHAGKAKDYAKKFGKTTVDKTNTVVSQTKLKLAISKTEDKVKEVYAQIGGEIYESYAEGAGVPDVQAFCEKLDDLHKEIENLKEQLAEVSENVKCANCGAYNRQEDAYCAKCGEKLTVEKAAKTAEKVVEEVVEAATPEE